MPTYQYACTNPETKHEFEVVHSFTDPAVTSCPECATPVRKVYGSVGVVFKGSGFYRTDSRDAKASTSASASKEGSAKEAASSSSAGKESNSSSAGKDSGASSSSSGTSSPSPSSSTSSSGGSGSSPT